MARYRTTGLRPDQVLLAHCLRIVYDMVRMTRIVSAWACIATTSSPMREAWQASHTFIHSSICCGLDKMLNIREEALIAQKRTCLYYLSAALILLKDQEKKKKEQAKEEITPARKQGQCG